MNSRMLYPAGIPSLVRRVEVDICIFSYSDRDFQYHRGLVPSDSGPGAVTEQLIRLLSNLFIHGPHFLLGCRYYYSRLFPSVNKSPRNDLLHAETLTINLVPTLVLTSAGQYEPDGGYPRALRWLKVLLSDMVYDGLLSGKVGKLKLRYGSEVKEWEIEDKEVELNDPWHWDFWGWR